MRFVVSLTLLLGIFLSCNGWCVGGATASNNGRMSWYATSGVSKWSV